MRYLLIISIVFLAFSSLTAQTKKQYVEAAEEATFAGDKYNALSFYLEAMDFDTTDTEILYRTAKAALEFSSFNLAEKIFAKIVELDSNDEYPLTYYFLGEVVKMQGDYDTAKLYYSLYLTLHEGDDDYYTAKSQKEINACDWALDVIKNRDSTVSITHLGTDINTPDSEFGGVVEEDGISFSSMSFQSETNKLIPVKNISRILRAPIGEPPVDYAPFINQDTQLTAHLTYNFNRSKIFYTECQYGKEIEHEFDISCALYTRPVLGDGTLGNKIRLPESINLDGYTATQPNVGFDKKLGKEVLYFVSDRPDADGNTDLDIWYSVIEGLNDFGDPMNLVKINTHEADITPYFHSNTQVLYFSSRGYTSLGGYDIYRSAQQDGIFDSPKNMGAPYNSNKDDIYFGLSSDGKSGILSSSRDSSIRLDVINESCCFDLYSLDLSEKSIRLNVLTSDCESRDSLVGVTVSLIDATTGDLLTTMTNDQSIEHIFQLEPDKKYTIISTKDGHRSDTIQYNTTRIYGSKDVVKRVCLDPMTINLQVLTFDSISRNELPGTTVRLEDLTDNTIRDIVLTNPTGHDFMFDISRGHRYRILASKEKYYDKESVFTASSSDGSGTIVKKLYLRRKPIEFCFPLAVYFDNDVPLRKGALLNTKMTYTESFDNYYIFRKQDFIKEYTRGLDGKAAENAEKEVRNFFDHDLKEGYDQFQNCLALILQELRKGTRFELSIRGYTSPRADSRYNLALGQRRVKAIQNEIRTFDNGAFKEYINDGRLKITELSYGENLAPKSISDLLNDERGSIYSPEASRERKAEIVEIRSLNLKN